MIANIAFSVIMLHQQSNLRFDYNFLNLLLSYFIDQKCLLWCCTR